MRPDPEVYRKRLIEIGNRLATLWMEKEKSMANNKFEDRLNGCEKVYNDLLNRVARLEGFAPPKNQATVEPTSFQYKDIAAKQADIIDNYRTTIGTLLGTPGALNDSSLLDALELAYNTLREENRILRDRLENLGSMVNAYKDAEQTQSVTRCNCGPSSECKICSKVR